MFLSLHDKVLVSCSLFIALCLASTNDSKSIPVNTTNSGENTWVFVMAGQSNMAGRGIIEAEDKISDKRILSIDINGKLITAKEPLHFYEPTLAGLDCGVSFAKTLLQSVPSNISILMMPTAIGGSSINQWLRDSLYRGVRLYSNFTDKVLLAKKYGTIKGILWHQGESDTNPRDIPLYKQRLGLLFSKFRKTVGNESLPVIIGELGSYSNNQDNWNLLNKEINQYAAGDKNCTVVSTGDLKDKGDHLHFNSEGQRMLGKRFAEAWLKFN